MSSTAGSNPDVKTREPSGSVARLKLAREWHLYLGTFFAPSIIFFAITGALQLFGLHESHPGDAYQPPGWVQQLASIHKDQILAEKHPRPPGGDGQPRPEESSEAPRPPKPPESGGRQEEGGSHKSTLALKYFFLAMTAGLVFSTLLGIYMAFKYNRNRRLVGGLLIVGAVIPAALIALMA